MYNVKLDLKLVFMTWNIKHEHHELPKGPEPLHQHPKI